MVEEHHHQLQRARRAHSADLVLICTALDEEVHEALVQKHQELGEARGALNRASTVVSQADIWQFLEVSAWVYSIPVIQIRYLVGHRTSFIFI